MKAYFSHGKESGPWGTKIRYLTAIASDLGMAVESVDYQDLDDPDARAERLKALLANEADSVVLVGSSMGGYVSTLAATAGHGIGLFLLAPALFIPGYQVQAFELPPIPIEVVHGWGDDVIPADHSIRFCRQHSATLHLIDGDHRLNDRLPEIGSMFADFLKRVLEP